MTKCILSDDINSCKHYDSENSLCLNPNTCSFQEIMRGKDMNRTDYVRTERWYEKYYRKMKK